MTDENKELARRAIAAANNRDSDGFSEVFKDDVVVHGTAGNIRGVDTLVEGVWEEMEAFPDIERTIDVILSEQDLVALQYTATATHEGEFEGVSPTGETVEFTAMRIARIEDGRIAELWTVSDELGLLEQIDAIESPPATE